MRFKDEKGSVTVEAALLMPLLLTVFFSFLFLNNTIKDNIIIQNAAREGARAYAMTGSSSTGINRAGEEVLKGGIDPNEVTITPLTIKDTRGMRVEKDVLLIKLGTFFESGIFSLQSEMYFHKWQ